jgi:mannose-6-phosphate isomerase-like protein (cupin superfamily)
MGRFLVFNSNDVVGFTNAEDVYESRMLIDVNNSGSDRVQINHFTLRPGKISGPGSHPEPYNEIYYFLRGKALLRLGDPPEVFEARPGHIAFIPAGTPHGLENIGDEDLVILTIWPGPIAEGANELYDMRLAAWGKTFKLVGDK